VPGGRLERGKCNRKDEGQVGNLHLGVRIGLYVELFCWRGCYVSAQD
jgi:hypothetical protein